MPMAIPAGMPRLNRSALADPAKTRLGGGLRLLVLAITPGAARALLVAPVTAGQADHGSIVP
jgi:hypothetical protein